MTPEEQADLMNEVDAVLEALGKTPADVCLIGWQRSTNGGILPSVWLWPRLRSQGNQGGATEADPMWAYSTRTH